jgi:hypothetical protein
MIFWNQTWWLPKKSTYALKKYHINVKSLSLWGVTHQVISMTLFKKNGSIRGEIVKKLLYCISSKGGHGQTW